MNIWQSFVSMFSGKPKEVYKDYPGWKGLGSQLSTTTDFWGRPQPTNTELIRAFNDTVYSCATLVSNNVATVPIRLYVKTEPGQARPKNVTTRPLIKSQIDSIRKKQIGKGVKVEEVTNHPVLELLNHCNSYHNYQELLQLTQLYLDVCGNAFWYLLTDGYGLPIEIYLLPTQSVEPIRGDTGYIIGWRVRVGNNETEYGLEDVIHFKNPSLADPYGMGLSPVMAAWYRVQIGAKELGYLDATLTNMGRPDAILSPDEAISPFEAERLAKDFFQRFRGQGNGGIVVADGPMKILPLNFPPRDLAELELYKVIKYSVSNAFGVPPDIWEIGQANRSSAEAVLYALATHSIKPRIARIVEKLNERLIPFFSDRLFFESDSPIPEDKAFLQTERQMLLVTGTITRDEARQLYGFDSVEWATVPLSPPGSMPPEALLGNQEAPTEQPQAEKEDRSGQAPIIANLQTLVNSGQINREGAIANVVLTLGLTPEQAQGLFPQAPPVVNAPIADEAPPQAPQEQPGGQEGKPEKPAPAPVKLPPDQGNGKKPKTLKKKGIIDVPDFRQTLPYDCGAVAVKMVAEYFGYPEQEEGAYVEELGTTETDGTSPQAIVTFLEHIGLKVAAHDDWSIDQLELIVNQGIPVIVPIQDYEDNPAGIADEQAGHYVVIIGVERKSDDLFITLADPVDGRVRMESVEFLGRWEDTDGKEELIHYGMAVSKTPEQPGDKSFKAIKAIPKRKSPVQMAIALNKFFARQKQTILDHFKSSPELNTKAIGEDWFDMKHWIDEMYKDLRPVVQLYSDDSAKKTIARIGASFDLLKVTQPKLKEGVDKATMIFCKETNDATSQEIGGAIKELRASLAEGLEQGEYNNQLMKRVGGVFEQAEVYRSWRIAVTEANRAQHSAQFTVAKESGIVQGKKWILSSDACPKCQPLKGKVVALDANFASIDSGAYSDIPYPPLHPNCRCDAIEIIEGVND